MSLSRLRSLIWRALACVETTWAAVQLFYREQRVSYAAAPHAQDVLVFLQAQNSQTGSPGPLAPSELKQRSIKVPWQDLTSY